MTEYWCPVHGKDVEWVALKGDAHVFCQTCYNNTGTFTMPSARHVVEAIKEEGRGEVEELLDEVDARDSLAMVEFEARIRADELRQTTLGIATWLRSGIVSESCDDDEDRADAIERYDWIKNMPYRKNNED